MSKANKPGAAKEQRARTNTAIRVPRVRLIGAENEQLGVVTTSEALEMARLAELDLVEVAPNADPPVCRIMDYGKYQYQQKKKARSSAKNQKKSQLKEVKFRCKIDEHDIQTKVNRISTFLKEGDKVKIQVDFRGREIVHKDVGFDLIKRIISMTEEFAAVERDPKAEGRSINAYLAPKKPGSVKKKPPTPAVAPEKKAGDAAPQEPAPPPAPAPEPAATST